MSSANPLPIVVPTFLLRALRPYTLNETPNAKHVVAKTTIRAEDTNKSLLCQCL